MKTYEGILHGFFETGCEGVMPALQEFKHTGEDGKCWSYDGLQFIDPSDHLIIYKDGKEMFNGIIKAITSEGDNLTLINESGISAGWLKLPQDSEYKQPHINACWVHYLPTNIDLKLWWDVFFLNDGKYTGVLKKEEK